MVLAIFRTELKNIAENWTINFVEWRRSIAKRLAM